MLKGCLTVVGVVVLAAIGVGVYFAVRTTKAVNHASVSGTALTTINVGDTRAHVDQVLGKDGSDDATIFGNGHTPPGTTCRYFIATSQRKLNHIPVHRVCFSNATSRVQSISVYPQKST